MDKLNAIANQLAAIWKRISFNQRVSIVLVAVAAVIGLWVFAKVSHRPSRALLYPELLDPTDAAAIAEKLRDEGVAFEVRDGGRRIYVPAQRVDMLRLAMAGAGLPANTGGTGWGDVFDKRGLGGQSETMVNINKLRALQGELARTISSLSGVHAARVHLVMPEEPLFKTDKKPAKASIVLTLKPGYGLGPAERDGIRYLVASAIDGLKTNNITILDQDGQLLAKPTDEGSLVDVGGDQIALARGIESDLLAKIRAPLDAAVGPDNWSGSCTVELKTQSVKTEETKNTDGATVTEEISKSKSEGESRAAGGEPGAVPNLDVSASGGGSTRGSSDTTETTVTHTAPNTTTTTTVVPPGSIKKVSASVILNKDRKPTTADGTTLSVADVKTLVETVIMYDSVRGDKVSVTEASFVEAKTADENVPSAPSPIMGGIAKHGPAVILSIALLGFLWAFMKKSKYAEHTPVIAAPVRTSAAAPASGGGKAAESMFPEAIASDKKVKQIFEEIVLEESEAELRGLREAMGQLAEQRPEAVAAVIREWIS